jgi:hypothetical protein
MAAGIYNFIIEQGATTTFRIDYSDSSGNPIDLTYYNARMQIRNEPGGSKLYATFSSSLSADGSGLNLTPSSASVILPKSSGSIGVVISAYSSSLFLFDKAYYDIELTSGSGFSKQVVRLLQGKIKLSKEVTRD